MPITEKLFSLQKHHTTIKTEILAGCTTFMSIVFILFVNPIMLAESGMPLDAAFTATVWASIIPTLIMAFFANLPIALAPGMGVNAFFTYTLVLGMGLSWENALAAVFVSGLLFLILAILDVPKHIMRAIPHHLKASIGVGIGFFIALVGFQNAGLTVADPATMLNLGDMSNQSTLIAIFGLILSAVLLKKHISGGLLWGILAMTGVAMCLGISPIPSSLKDIVSFNIPSLTPIFLKLDFLAIMKVSFLAVLFSMTMVDLFNAMGTMIGLSSKADFEQEDGSIRGLRAAMIADSSGTLIGSLLGTSPVTSYLESITGISEGGRTGLCALTVAVLLFISLIFAPLIQLIPQFATAPALILVGLFMMQDMRHIDLSDMTEALPAFLTIVSMPFTYNIVTGFGLGFISYCIMKSLTGGFREIPLVLWAISLCFLMNFIII